MSAAGEMAANDSPNTSQAASTLPLHSEAASASSAPSSAQPSSTASTASSSSSPPSSSPASTSISSPPPSSSVSASPTAPSLSSSASPALSAKVKAGGDAFSLALGVLLRNSLVEVMEALETLLVYTKNLIAFPDEKKYRKIKVSNIHYQERLGHLPGAIEAMTAIGYAPVGDYLRLDEKKMSEPDNEAVLRRMEELVSERLAEVKRGWQELPARLDDAHHYSSVQGAGSYSAIGKRHNMEDDEIIVDRFCGNSGQGYFGLYDGHGGRATVDFVVKALHLNLEQHMKRNPSTSLCDAFKQSYLATDGQLRRQNILRSGTTSVTCVVRAETGGKRWLFTANVGDSRAVLCRGGKAVRLTIDHKASLPEEAKRITDAGGFIGRNKRVNGVLAISRALGDHMLKENDVVSAEPFCSDTQLTPEDSHILLACDGVWDVMSDQEAIDFLRSKLQHFEARFSEWRQQHGGDAAEAVGYDTDDGGKAAGNETKAAEGDDDSPMNGTDDAMDSNGSGHATHSSGVDGQQAPHSASAAVDALDCPRNLNEVLSLTAKALVKEALDRRSLDNVTVMIIAL